MSDYDALREDGLPCGEADERTLWERCGAGDDSARESLILAYRPMVFWLAKKFTAGFQARQDMVQEGMLALIRAVDSFDPARGVRFITYAYYRVKGQMVNFLQRSEARAPLPVEPDSIAGEASFEVDIERMELALALRDGFESLPEREADIVRSLMIEGRKAADVANDHGVGVSHVYRLQRRALEKLRTWFSGEDATSEA